jgi:hypothetical protein
MSSLSILSDKIAYSELILLGEANVFVIKQDVTEQEGKFIHNRDKK